jgi:hypothetical protein
MISRRNFTMSQKHKERGKEAQKTMKEIPFVGYTLHEFFSSVKKR